MITQMSDFTGNFRLPAGVPSDILQAAIFSGDVELLSNFFDISTVSYLKNNQTSIIVNNLQFGQFGFLYQWRELSVPFIFARTNWAIMGFSKDTPPQNQQLFYTIYSMIDEFDENFMILFNDVFIFDVSLFSVNQNQAIYELIDSEKRINQINWLDTNMILSNENESEFYTLLQIDNNNFRILVDNINNIFPDRFKMRSPLKKSKRLNKKILNV